MTHMQNNSAKPIGPGFVSKFEEQAATRKRLFFIMIAFIILAIVLSMIGNAYDKRHGTPSKATVTQAYDEQQNTRTTLPDSYKQVLATMINLNGELCATITAVSRIQKDIYQVYCIRYRDGSGTASYEVNVRTGGVK